MGFLCSDLFDVYIYPMINEFWAYFVHLSFCLQAGSALPFQVPIAIRCQLNPYYHDAWQELHKFQSKITDEAIAKYIDAISNPYQKGVTLFAILELLIVKDGPLRGTSIMNSVTRQSDTLDFLTCTSEDQLANLLATYIRVLGFKILRNPASLWDEQAYADMLAFVQRVCRLCTPYNDHSSNERSSSFAAVINKLEGIEIPFCLWIYVDGLVSNPTSNVDSHIEILYRRMEGRFLSLAPQCELPWLVPALCSMHFLLLAIRRFPNCPFFDLLHSTMVKCCGEDEWKAVWQVCGKRTQLKRQIELRQQRGMRW